MEKVSNGSGISDGSAPRPLSPALLILSVPGSRGLFRHVPPEHIFGEHVQCPCGEAHELQGVGELHREGCGRWFIRTERTVLCYREPEGADSELGALCPTVRREAGEWVEVSA